MFIKVNTKGVINIIQEIMTTLVIEFLLVKDVKSL